MNGYLINKETREVLIIVKDVIESTHDKIVGKQDRIEGISEQALVIVTDTLYKEGDIIPIEEIDKSSAFKTQAQINAELIAENERIKKALDELLLGGAL